MFNIPDLPVLSTLCSQQAGWFQPNQLATTLNSPIYLYLFLQGWGISLKHHYFYYIPLKI